MIEEERALRHPTPLDELPVGKAQTQFLEEYPPGYDPNQEQQQPTEIPLKLRMKSKIVKQRVSAYDDILQALNDGSELDVALDSNDLVQFVQDPNLNAQDKGLQVVILWMEKHPSTEFDMKEISKATIEKVLVQSKPAIKKLGNDILISVFERGCFPAIQEALLHCTCSKNPKIVCAALQAIIELLTQFGYRKLDQLKVFWSKAEELSQSQQSVVKNEAMALYREAGRWMGRAIEGKIQKLKKEQQEEILKFVDAIPEGTVMRPLRGSATEDAVSLKDLKDFDAYDHVEAVDALNKYNESWCDKVLALEKWIEKKDALELLLKSVSVTKIHPNPNNLYPIVQMLKKLINHSNVAIQLVAIKIAGYMAGGLRKNFTHSCKIILTPMMQKLKDKKQQVIDEVNGAIKRFFYVLTLDDLMDDIKEVLEDKAWGARVNAINVIEVYIDTQTKPLLLKQTAIRNLPMLLKRFIEDGAQEVREKSLLVLAKLQGKVYEGSLKREFADLKPDKVNKINQLAQTYLPNTKEVVSAPNSYRAIEIEKPQQQVAAIVPLAVARQAQPQNEQSTAPRQPPKPKSVPPPEEPVRQQVKFREEPPKQTSVFQNKEQRIQLEIQNPFPLNTLSDPHIETLKQMFHLPGVPTPLYTNLFSMNQQNNIKAIRYIRQKLNKASELSDILIKWAFSIGWFRESVQLQSEILQFLNFLLFQLRQENYEIHVTETRIIKGYLHMLVYMICKCNQPHFAQRTLPLVMQIAQNIQDSPKGIPRFEDDEDPQSGETLRKLHTLLEQIQHRINEWSQSDSLKNRAIVADLVACISPNQSKGLYQHNPPQHAPLPSQHQAPLPPQHQAAPPQHQPVLAQQPTQHHYQPPQQASQPSVILCEEPPRAVTSSVQSQSQPASMLITAAQRSKSDQYYIVSEQVRQFQITSRLHFNDPSRGNLPNIIDLAIRLGVALFQLRDNHLIQEFCVELGNTMTQDVTQVPYEKFYAIISWLFNQILAEVNSKDEQTKLRCLNGVMVKILTAGDVTNNYLSLLDIITRERQSNTNQGLLQQQISLCTRCLNKVLGNLKNKLSISNLTMILERFNNYLSRYCQFPDGLPPDASRRGDDILAKAMKTAMLLFVKLNESREIIQVLEGQLKLNQQSHLYRWVLEQNEPEEQPFSLASKRYSLIRNEPTAIRSIFETLNRHDDQFERGLDQLISFLKRNKGSHTSPKMVGYDWKSQVIADHPRMRYMEEKVEFMTVDMNINLEKKVVELASLKETMNQ